MRATHGVSISRVSLEMALLKLRRGCLVRSPVAGRRFRGTRPSARTWSCCGTTAQSWWYGRQHVMNHFIMDPLEEAGTAPVASCFFQILQFNVEYRNNFVFGIGTRDDVLARIDGRWVFQSLRVNASTEMDQVPWKAELLMKPLLKGGRAGEDAEGAPK